MAFVLVAERSALVSEYPLVGDEGQRIPNHRIKLLGPIDRLPGVVTVGNPNGKTTLIEFYDLNCPFCRIASTDVGDLIDVDSELKLVLVPYPVLGVASIAASRVELAIAKLGTPEQFYAFHRKIYSQRGTTDGLHAFLYCWRHFPDHALSARQRRLLVCSRRAARPRRGTVLDHASPIAHSRCRR